VNVDIFSCSTRLKSLAAIEELGRSFGAAGVSVQEILRADGHDSRSDSDSVM
jgi:S-adenosylmethionine/arginine decarboxylase-like enzyme